MNMQRKTIPSPCVGVCKIDMKTGLCKGCARSDAEITNWRRQSDDWRQDVWDALPERFRMLGITARRLPWTAEEIADRVFNMLEQRSGTWVFGTYGAVAEFNAAPDEEMPLRRDGNRIEAITAQGAIRFDIGVATTRALEVSQPDQPGRLVLVCPRERTTIPVKPRLHNLGPDRNALRDRDRNAQLYDIGLGRRSSRFLVRTEDQGLINALDTVSGEPFMDNLSRVGPSIMSSMPHRVVETACGRLEVFTPIPPMGAKSPRGPHTHLLPDQLALNRETAPGIDIPYPYFMAGIHFDKAPR